MPRQPLAADRAGLFREHPALGLTLGCLFVSAIGLTFSCAPCRRFGVHFFLSRTSAISS